MSITEAQIATAYVTYLRGYVDCLAKVSPGRDEHIRETQEATLAKALGWRHASQGKDPVRRSELATMLTELLG